MIYKKLVILFALLFCTQGAVNAAYVNSRNMALLVIGLDTANLLNQIGILGSHFYKKSILNIYDQLTNNNQSVVDRLLAHQNQYQNVWKTVSWTGFGIYHINSLGVNLMVMGNHILLFTNKNYPNRNNWYHEHKKTILAIRTPISLVGIAMMALPSYFLTTTSNKVNNDLSEIYRFFHSFNQSNIRDNDINSFNLTSFESILNHVFDAKESYFFPNNQSFSFKPLLLDSKNEITLPISIGIKEFKKDLIRLGKIENESRKLLKITTVTSLTEPAFYMFKTITYDQLRKSLLIKKVLSRDIVQYILSPEEFNQISYPLLKPIIKSWVFQTIFKNTDTNYIVPLNNNDDDTLEVIFSFEMPPVEQTEVSTVVNLESNLINFFKNNEITEELLTNSPEYETYLKKILGGSVFKKLLPLSQIPQVSIDVYSSNEMRH